MDKKKLELIEYKNIYKDDYISLNMNWLKKYELLEKKDISILENVEDEILKKNGKVFLLKIKDGEIIGTVGMLPQSKDVVEIIKLAVDEKYKGLGLGEYLMLELIEKIIELNYKSIILYTSSKLKAALNLYKKIGFIESPIAEENLYEEADIKMIYSISSNIQ